MMPFISLVSDDDETEKGQGVLVHVSASTDGGGSSSGVVAKDLAFWGPWLAGSAAIIRDISFRIQPEMTPFGYSILMLGTEMCDKDCPKARSGGACFAAARILEVPPQQMVSWMKRAEQVTICEGGAHRVAASQKTSAHVRIIASSSQVPLYIIY